MKRLVADLPLTGSVTQIADTERSAPPLVNTNLADHYYHHHDHHDHDDDMVTDHDQPLPKVRKVPALANTKLTAYHHKPNFPKVPKGILGCLKVWSFSELM